ncbi:MAG: hypothetical protein AAFN13_10270 [Bacteroidota bacterium]
MRVAWLLSVLAFAGCDPTSTLDGIACTTEARPALTVTVSTETVSTEQGDPSVDTVSVEFRDGDFVEVAEWRPPGGTPWGSFSGAFERPGTYTVSVDANGYQPWVRSNVEVGETPDGCHVETVLLDARLLPLPR